VATDAAEPLLAPPEPQAASTAPEAAPTSRTRRDIWIVVGRCGVGSVGLTMPHER